MSGPKKQPQPANQNPHSSSLTGDKLPPHDIESEESTLGSIMVDPGVMDEVALFLKPGHFFREHNGWIYQAMIDLYVHDDPIDQVTLSQKLTASNKLEAVGGPGYLSMLVSRTPTSIHAMYYAQIVQRMFVYRQLMQAGGAITQIAATANGSVADALTQAQGLLEKLWEEAERTPLNITNLRRIGRDSPIYHLTVNGVDIKSEAKVLLDYKSFRQLVLEACDFIPPKMKQDEWEARINRLLLNMQKDPGPLESSETHLVWFAAKKHLRETQVVETLDEFQAGRVLEKNDALYIKGEHLLQGVRQRMKNPSLKAHWFWDAMKEHGAKDTTTRIGTKTTGCWRFPLSSLEEQEQQPDDDQPLLF